MALKRKEAPAKRKKAKTKRGLGSADVTVKGKKATVRQRNVLDGILDQCEDDGASRRVMVAAVMCAIQESVAGEEQGRTGDDDLGIYHQGRNWIDEAGAKDPRRATHAFLITGPTSWKKVHGGVKRAPGDLNAALMKVQISVGGYAPWESEASDIVDAWLDAGGTTASESDGIIKRYSFTRGERGGERENSWEAADRLVKEVGAFRWAAANVFYAVSMDELRRGKPSLTIHGDEGWLRMHPAWTWSSRRSITEMTLEVFADRWDVMPGGVVLLHRKLGAMSGRWVVFNVSGPALDSPEATVVLRRPVRLREEPASERTEGAEEDGPEGAAGTTERLRSACREISAKRSDYLYGGGHGPPVGELKSNSHLDCSSSTSLALSRAGFFEKDRPAMTSGEFAESWGEPGKGDEFTVWASPTHVWIEFKDPYGRFDTSQHDGKSGPAYTTKKRSTKGFEPRHWRGH